MEKEKEKSKGLHKERDRDKIDTPVSSSIRPHGPNANGLPLGFIQAMAVSASVSTSTSTLSDRLNQPVRKCKDTFQY